MKIVHVVPALTKGGGERVAVDLANAAVADGHEVAMLLAYPVDPALLQDRLDTRVELRFLRHRPSRFAPYLELPGWLRRHRSWIASRDIVHCHLTFGTVAGSMIQALRGWWKLDRPAVVETYHAVGMNIPRWRRRWDAARLAKRDAVALVAEDSFWAKFRKRQGPVKVRVITNGVSPNSKPSKFEVERYRKAIGLPPDALVIGSVGRLVPERRPDLLLSSFAEIARERSDIHLLLAGEGSDRSRLEAQRANLGLETRVHMPGLVNDPAAAFGTIDLYWTMNVGSTTGIAALEAAMVGLPILALQPDPDYRAAADDWIWSSGNPRSLATHSRELLSNQEQLAALAAAQQAHARKHHGVEAMAKAYYGLYTAALNGNPI